MDPTPAGRSPLRLSSLLTRLALRPLPPVFMRVLWTVALWLAATLGTEWLAEAGSTLRSSLFYLAVAASAVVGGLWAGLLATVLSALTIGYLYLAPPASFAIAGPADLLPLLAFVAVCTLGSFLIDALRAAVGDAERSRSMAEEARAAAQASEAQMHTAMEAAPQMAWRSRADGTVEFFNSRWYEFTGLTAGDASPVSWMSVVHAEDLPRVRMLREAAIGSGEPYTLDVRFRRRDGIYRWFTARVAPVRGPDGAVVGWAGAALDVHDRRQAEALSVELVRQVEEQRATLDAVIAQMPAGLTLSQAPSGAILYHNPESERLLGHPMHPSQAVEEYAAFGALHPDGTPYAAGEYPAARALAGETVDQHTMVYRRGDGRLARLSVSAAPVRDGAGRVTHAVCTFTDITAQRLAAERTQRLQRASAGLAAALTPVEVTRVFVEHVVAECGAFAGSLALVDEGGETASFAHTVGYQQAEVARWRTFPVAAPTPFGDAIRTGSPVVLASMEEWEARYPALVESTRATGNAALVSLPLVLAERTIGVLGVGYATPQRLSDDEVAYLSTLAGIVAQALDRARAYEAAEAARHEAERRTRESDALREITRDILSRVELETALERIAHHARALLGADFTAVATVSAEGRTHWLTTVGSRSERWRSLEFAAGRGTAGRVVAANAPLVIQGFPHNPEFPAEEFPAQAAEGMRSALGVPLNGPGGEPFGALVVGWRTPTEVGGHEIDLAMALARPASIAIENARLFDELEEARQAAEEANRAKAQFLASMSHELRTPLNAIGGYAELIELGIRGPVTEGQREDLGKIKRSQRHLLGLINDILNFARVEAGRIEYDLRDVSAAAIIEEMELLVQPQMDAKRQRYECRLDDPTLVVHADAEKVKQVLINLVGNALKFTPEGGVIRVEAAAVDAERVAVRVVDSGVGIPADRLEAIFDPFVQVGASRSHGTGLGLAISRELARGMGGALHAESTPGVGSTFTLLLPRTA